MNQEVKQSQILEQTDIMQERLGKLENLTKDLLTRLIPVLRDPKPEALAEKGPSVELSLAPLAENLRAKSYTLNEVNKDIASAIFRLEL